MQLWALLNPVFKPAKQNDPIAANIDVRVRGSAH